MYRTSKIVTFPFKMKNISPLPHQDHLCIFIHLLLRLQAHLRTHGAVVTSHQAAGISGAVPVAWVVNQENYSWTLLRVPGPVVSVRL
jgi:hypothetical protein